MVDPIDMLVAMYRLNSKADRCIPKFLDTLRNKCNLEGVNVFCVNRVVRPVPRSIRRMIREFGFKLLDCPLPQHNSCQEDTGRYCDWMIDHIGYSPWIAVSHFDLIFVGDYISYVRSLMPTADMIGNHHDGIVFLRREAYQRCRVGFYQVDAWCGGARFSLDVGELLALRMNTLRLRHILLRNRNGEGKSDLFIHTREGSGHRGEQVEEDGQPNLPCYVDGGGPQYRGVQYYGSGGVSESGSVPVASPAVIVLNESDIHLEIAGNCLCGLCGHQPKTNCIKSATCKVCLSYADRFPNRWGQNEHS